MKLSVFLGCDYLPYHKQARAVVLACGYIMILPCGGGYMQLYSFDLRCQSAIFGDTWMITWQVDDWKIGKYANIIKNIVG